MGTPAFAVPVLTSLLDAGHECAGVYTQPDKPSGRGKRSAASAVKSFAIERGLRVFQPSSLRRAEVSDELAILSPDLIVVAAYGKFLPANVLELPPMGCLNIHPSLLPKYRGPSPVAAAILSGDESTGVSIIKLDEGMDTGPIVGQLETPIAPNETADALTMRLFEMGATLLVESLPAWTDGSLAAAPQDESKASVTSRLSRKDGGIDWSLPASHIALQVRAYHPWPGTFTSWQGRSLKIIEASVESEATDVVPGSVTGLSDGGLLIGAGRGALRVRRLQLEGRQPVTADEFVRGYPAVVGATLGE